MDGSREKAIKVLLTSFVVLFITYVVYVSSGGISGAVVGGSGILEADGQVVTYSCENISLINDSLSMISVPVNLRYDGIDDVFGRYSDRIKIIYEYNHSTGDFDYHFFDYDIGTISDIYAGNCYLLKPTDILRLSFEGDDYFTNISKYLTTENNNWNFIGWINESVPIDEAFRSIDGNYTYSYYYNNSEGVFKYNYAPASIRNYENVLPCGCQIIKSNDEATLIYSLEN